MSDEANKKLKQIIISAIAFIIVVIIDKTNNISLINKFLLYLIPFLIAGFDVIKEAIEKIIHREFMEEEFLMTIATTGAMLIGFLPNGKEQFIEAVFVMLFYNVGELFEKIAEGTTEKTIKSLLDIRPDYANIEKDNKIVKIKPEELKVGDIIKILPGEKVPVDGMIIKGSTTLNTAAITGESVPRVAKENDEILSGSINISGTIEVKTTNTFEKSTASKIIDLVKNATEHKSKDEKFITKFARIYTPIVVALAVVLAIVPPILSGNFLLNFTNWLTKSLTFLIVSCPCALVISVPLAFFGGIGGASKQGIIIKGSDIIDKITRVKTVILDKTGTITEGVFEVTAIHSINNDEKELLHIAADVERYSNHPIAKSLMKAYGKEDDDKCIVTEHIEIPGQGIKAKLNDKEIYVGNEKLMNAIGVDISHYKHKDDFGTIIYVVLDKQYLGHIIISDKIKKGIKNGIEGLNSKNIKTIMLTGDHEDIAKHVAEEVNINEYYAELLPEDKLSKLEKFINNEKSKNVIFVGDGINDSPALARADVGISMGNLGSDAAIESSDVILMDDNVEKINNLIDISKKTIKISKENIFISLIIKIAVLVLATFGFAPMQLAIFADVGVTILATLNSMRTLSNKNK